jgi:3-hydroxybutyryl-CoA dehydrogenase
MSSTIDDWNPLWSNDKDKKLLQKINGCRCKHENRLRNSRRWIPNDDIAEPLLREKELGLFFTPHFSKFSKYMSNTTGTSMVKHLGIVGAGAMGAGIAQLAALSGIDVALYDINDTLLRQALERLKRGLNIAVEKGELNAPQSTEAFVRIHPRTRLADLSHSEIVIEAVIEDLRIKKDLFKHLEASTKPTTILASNTSFLSIAAIASATNRPEKIVGLHFLYPVEKVKIVEIVRTDQTTEQTLQRCRDFLTQLARTSVTVTDAPGYIFNRISHPLYGQALEILGEHIADAEQIDRIMKSEGGFTQGPFESLDAMGLDTSLNTTNSLFQGSSCDSRFRAHPIQKRMVDSGLLGKKSGRGFYTYEQEKK